MQGQNREDCGDPLKGIRLGNVKLRSVCGTEGCWSLEAAAIIQARQKSDPK